MTDTPLLVTTKEGARIAGVGRDFAYELVRSGMWPSVSVGSKRLIPRSAIEAWAEQIARRRGAIRKNGKKEPSRGRKKAAP